MAGKARHGLARRGGARQAWLGMAWRGEARLGAARQARHGKARDLLFKIKKRRKKLNTQILKLKKELEIIRQKNKGMLTPEKIVEYAKNKDTILHSHFCWDDTKAAREYRLHQASCIIRDVKVTIVTPKKETIRIREYVSLPADRGMEKGKSKGYRHIDQVLTEDDLRLQYIESVQKEFKAIQLKLKTISEFVYKKSEALGKQIEKERQSQIRKVVSLKEAIV